MACKQGQVYVVKLMVNNQCNYLRINLKALHVNGMTSFDVRLLGTLE